MPTYASISPSCRWSRSIRLGDDAWENRVVTTYYQLHKLENLTKREPLTFHDEWERRNRDFHQALESGCGSPWLLHFCDILYDQLERYRRRFVVYTDIHPTIAEEHRQIMELALARDPAACKVLKQHFEHAASVIGRMMAESAKAASTRRSPRRPLNRLPRQSRSQQQSPRIHASPDADPTPCIRLAI